MNPPAESHRSGSAGELAALRRRVSQLEADLRRERGATRAEADGISLATIIESLPHPFLVIDAEDHRVLLANSAAHAAGDPEGVTCHALNLGHDRPCGDYGHDCPLEQIKRSKRPLVMEQVHRTGVAEERHFELHAFPVLDENGSVQQIIEYRLDITQRKRDEAAILHQHDFVNLIAQISNDFLNLPVREIDAGFHRALRRIGEFAAVDRSYIFLYSADGRRMSNTHDWCAAGVRSVRHKLQDLDCERYAWSNRRLRAGSTLHVSRVADLPAESRQEQAAWERDGILSVLSVPLMLRGRVVGFLGFDMERREKTWPEELLVLLRLVGESFAKALDRREVEEKLQDERRFSDSMIDALPGLFYLFDQSGRFLRWNERVSLETGYDEEELGRMHPVDFVGASDRGAIREAMREALTQGESNLEAEILAKDGRRIPYFFSGRRVTLAGEPYLVGLGVDITERRRIEESLRESEERFRQIAEHIEEVFWLETVGDEPRFLYVNPGLAKLWGLDGDALLADRERFFGRVFERDRSRLRRVMDSPAGGNGERAVTFRVLRPDGALRWIWAKIFPVRDDTNRIVRRAGLALDITERKLADMKLRAARRRLGRLAGTDPLTALPNRRAMLDKLRYEMRRYERRSATFTVILGDIDKFKAVNDSHGHETGDRVLQAVGDLMRGVVRKQDTVARWGGEEFMLLLPDTDLAGGEILAEKLRRTVADLRLSRGEARVGVTITLGLCSYGGETDIQACIRRADEALYEGKSLGGNRSVLARGSKRQEETGVKAARASGN